MNFFTESDKIGILNKKPLLSILLIFQCLEHIVPENIEQCLTALIRYMKVKNYKQTESIKVCV